jgi:hypothetical protein
MTKSTQAAIAAYIEKVVAAAPPLTGSQKARLTALLAEPQQAVTSSPVQPDDGFDALREVRGDE